MKAGSPVYVWGWGVVFLLFVVASVCSKNGLNQGQKIKQFTSSSITQSLSQNGFSFLDTSLPCPDPRDNSYPLRWVEEPPIYHSFGALLFSLGLKKPQWPSLFVALGISLMIFWLLATKLTFFPKHFGIALLTCLSVPFFMRYYYQHLPDILGLLWLVIGVSALLSNRLLLCVVFFTLSVTTKALTIFPAAALICWALVFERSLKEKKLRLWVSLVASGVCVFVMAAPFFCWTQYLEAHQIPNPFNFSNFLESRHAGDWHFLLTFKYWKRLIMTIAPRGVGLPLFFAFLWSLWRSARKPEALSLERRMLIVWALSIVPSWIFIRAGSFIHDYYALPYFLPMAILGTEQLLRVTNKPVKILLLAASILTGLSYPISYGWKARDDSAPVKFCEQEAHSVERFSVPPR